MLDVSPSLLTEALCGDPKRERAALTAIFRAVVGTEPGTEISLVALRQVLHDAATIGASVHFDMCGVPFALRPEPVQIWPEWPVWRSMITRCDNKNDANYGGRGIDVCAAWRESFMAFAEHVGPRPSRRHSIDRFPNNNAGYKPGNVRWATAGEQANNTRKTEYLTLNGQRLSIAEWARRANMKSGTLRARVRRGIRPSDAVVDGGRCVVCIVQSIAEHVYGEGLKLINGLVPHEYRDQRVRSLHESAARLSDLTDRLRARVTDGFRSDSPILLTKRAFEKAHEAIAKADAALSIVATVGGAGLVLATGGKAA